MVKDFIIGDTKTDEYMRRLWSKAVIKLWDYQCAFPGCEQKKITAYRMSSKGVLRYNPFYGITSCAFHCDLVKIMKKALWKQKFNIDDKDTHLPRGIIHRLCVQIINKQEYHYGDK